MGRRHLWSGLTLGALVGPAAAVFAVAAPAHAEGFGASWMFTEPGSPPSVLSDYSGNGNNGTPEGGIVGDGTGFTFDGTGRVTVPDSPSLNPGTNDFSYTVTVTTGLPVTGTDYDLLRKGYSSTGGGEYKVEIINASGIARAYCLAKDTAGHTGHVRSGGSGASASLADGQAHTITCTKTSAHMTVTVDGLAPRSGSAVSGGFGTIGNNAPLTIGAKASGGTGGDWFFGRLTGASVSSGAPPPPPPRPPPPPPPGGAGAHWGFDEVGAPPTVLADDSGNGNKGTPHGGIVGDGAEFGFDGGSGLVNVPDSPSLDPGTVDFSFSVTLTTTVPAGSARYDVLRKGVGSTAGGYYGLEVINSGGKALAVCLVKDLAGHSATIRGSGGTLADGQQHTITCTKTATGLSAIVDGGSPHTKSVSSGLGSVDNGAPLVFGAMRTSGERWFAGSIADATLSY